MAPLHITNRQARQIWLSANGLHDSPTGKPDVMTVINKLGFVQLDTIRNVTRAHHHILWSRNSNYREKMLWPLLSERKLFEHFTHDASLIPMQFYPHWQAQFERLGARAARAPWYQSGMGQTEIARIKERIKHEGALSTHAFDSRANSREMWARPPHKKALEQMWYAGELGTSHREKFVKFYDLGERLFPTLDSRLSMQAQFDHLNDSAIERLLIANPGEIRRFWDAANVHAVTDWIKRKHLQEIRIESADGSWTNAYAVPDIEARLAQLNLSSNRIRIINPFDPAIRDRNRLARLFGFEYRNEMFVPAAKRQWGYYVYPLLEKDRFVGRIELTGDRKSKQLKLVNFWPEPSIKWGAQRKARLYSELTRFGRLAGLNEIYDPAGLLS